MKKILKFVGILLLLTFAVVGFMPDVALAQVNPGGPGGGNPAGNGGGINNPLGNNVSIASVLIGLVRWLLGLVGILALLALVIGGVRLILSFGREESIKDAKQIIFWAIAGLTVVIVSYAIIAVVGNVLLSAGLLEVPTAHAQNPQSVSDGINLVKEQVAAQDAGLVGGQGTTPGVGTLVSRVVAWLLGLTAILALLALVSGGVMYIVSFGNEQRAELAKKIILYAIIGLLVVGASFLILQVVRGVISDG